MKKQLLALFGSVILGFGAFGQTKGLIISEILTNPNGSDSPYEYVELLATTAINFSSTPYTVVFTDNGTATSNGWKAGGSVSYAFQINTGSVVAGQVVYVGGSSMIPLSNGGVALRTRNTGSNSGDNFGSSNSSGVLGNGGSNCDGVAVFNCSASSISSSTVPVDALFFGSAVGSAYKSSSSGYQMPVNDKYSGGKLSTSTYLAPDPGADELVKATAGVFDPVSNAFTTARTFAVTTTASYNTTSITLGGSNPVNVAPNVSLATPTVSGNAPATVGLSATASDSDGTITKVEFFNGSVLLASITNSPYTFSWTGVGAGTYSVTAKATDNSNVVTTSSVKTVTVNGTANTAPTLSWNTAASKYVDLASGKVGCVKGNATDPVSVTGLDFNVGDENLSTVTFSMTSSKTSVIANNAFTVTGTGTARKLIVNPTGVGYATITFKVTDAQGLNKSITMNIAVSASLATASLKDVYQAGVADGSTGIPVDDDYMFVADDETNVIKLFSRNNSGLSLYQFNVGTYLNLSGTEVDIEASFRSPTNPNRIYWIGSLSNSKSGEARPDRNRIFATDIVGSGANATLTFVGYYSNLRSKLITWGDNNGYNFTAKAATGIEPKRIDGFNIEGLEMGPDGTTLYIGFRAPYVGSGTNKALICPLLNFETWFNNGAPSGNPTFGAPIELNLANHGIRSLGKNAANQYLIVAGSYASTGTFALYSWNGLASSAPVALAVDLTNLKPEGIVTVPASLSGSFQVDLISDLGSNEIYNDGVENKDVSAPQQRKFLTSTLNVTAPSAIIVQTLGVAKESGTDLLGLTIYPNPVTDQLTINFDQTLNTDATFRIYDLSGAMVKEFQLKDVTNKVVLDVNNLNSGSYLIESSSFTGTIRMIKE